MKDYLKSKGFKPSLSSVLGNKEFRLVSTALTHSETLSTFAHPSSEVNEVYELFLSTQTYRESVVRGLLVDMRTQDSTGLVVQIETDERGYTLLLSFTIKE